MSRQILWTVLVFVVALVSGVVVGMNMPVREAPKRGEGSWLAKELKLSPEQQEKMKAIWQEMVPGRQGGRHSDGRRQLVRERDEAIANLVAPERKADYEAILARFDQQVAELGREREKAFQKAVEQTKAMLHPEQRTKYEELIRKGAFGPRRPGTNPSATQPAGQ